MRRKFDLPLLATLAAFEAFGRHHSFTRAVMELNLTQSAVSFQVRKLEHSLSVRLFVREHRSLALTARLGRGQGDFELPMEASDRLDDFRQEHVDLAMAPPPAAADLAAQPLLHDDMTDCTWQDWFRASGRIATFHPAARASAIQ